MSYGVKRLGQSRATDSDAQKPQRRAALRLCGKSKLFFIIQTDLYAWTYAENAAEKEIKD